MMVYSDCLSKTLNVTQMDFTKYILRMYMLSNKIVLIQLIYILQTVALPG